MALWPLRSPVSRTALYKAKRVIVAFDLDVRLRPFYPMAIREVPQR
jgi:hypothetical protein